MRTLRTSLPIKLTVKENNMAPIRQVSHRQLELIVEFAEAHRNIVLGNIGKGPLGQIEGNKAWEKLTRQLNSIGGGVIKTPAHWKRYWHLLKCRTKGKAADLRRSHVATGGGPNKTVPLSDLEERIVAVIGKVAVEGIPEVRIPLNLTAETQPSGSSSTPGQSTAPASSAIEMGLEYNVDTELEEEELECQEVELDSSLFELSTVPLSSTAELTSFAAPGREPHNSFTGADSSRGTLGATSSSRGTLGATGSSRGTLGATGSSQTSQTSSRPRPQSEPSTAPASSAAEPASSAAPEPHGTSAAAAGRPQPRAAPQRRSRPTRNRNENLPGWAYELEDRRIAVEERLVNEIAAQGVTNRGILECLQLLVQMLQAHLE